MKDNLDNLDYYFNQGNMPAKKSFLKKHWFFTCVTCALILICGVSAYLWYYFNKKGLSKKYPHYKKVSKHICWVSGAILGIWLVGWLYFSGSHSESGEYFHEGKLYDGVGPHRGRPSRL